MAVNYTGRFVNQMFSNEYNMKKTKCDAILFQWRQSGKSPEITFYDRVSKGVVKWLQNCWKPENMLNTNVVALDMTMTKLFIEYEPNYDTVDIAFI